VEDVAGFAAEPADVADRGVAPQDADMAAEVGLPGVGRAAAAGALQAAGQRQHREQHMAIGRHEVVHHAGEGCLEPVEASACPSAAMLP
jgi:hypothetical protein